MYALYATTQFSGRIRLATFSVLEGESFMNFTGWPFPSVEDWRNDDVTMQVYLESDDGEGSYIAS